MQTITTGKNMETPRGKGTIEGFVKGTEGQKHAAEKGRAAQGNCQAVGCQWAREEEQCWPVCDITKKWLYGSRGEIGV
jgi:hypothetical protein